jgi:hypothetical protein
MSISQFFVMCLGIPLAFIIVEAPESLKRALATMVVLLFAGFGWIMGWAILFSSEWYKGVEQAVGFTIGF